MAETVFPRVYGVAEINYYLKQYLAEDLFWANWQYAEKLAAISRIAPGIFIYSKKNRIALLGQ